MSYLKCEESAAGLVMNLFIANTGPRHFLHNLMHTIRVVNHVKEIAAFYQLNETTLCMLLMAGWFHDVGYLFGEVVQPLQTSITIMTGYLKATDVAPSLVEEACDCIRASASQPRLSSLSEKIICDAVTYDYGTSYFRETDGRKPSDSVQLLTNHVYYTEYCQL